MKTRYFDSQGRLTLNRNWASMQVSISEDAGGITVSLDVTGYEHRIVDSKGRVKFGKVWAGKVASIEIQGKLAFIKTLDIDTTRETRIVDGQGRITLGKGWVGKTVTLDVNGSVAHITKNEYCDFFDG